MKVLNALFKQKILMIIWPPYRQKILDIRSELEAQAMVEEDIRKYYIPSYMKPKTQSWEWWRARIGKGKMPF